MISIITTAPWMVLSYIIWLKVVIFSWWRHQMETFFALLAICAAGNSLVPGEFPAQRPVTRSFGVFFDLRLNKRFSKQSWDWWFETLSRPLWCHCNVHRNFTFVTPVFRHTNRLFDCTTWKPFAKCVMSSLVKSCGSSVCSNFDSNDLRRSWFCTCHESSADVPCAH